MFRKFHNSLFDVAFVKYPFANKEDIENFFIIPGIVNETDLTNLWFTVGYCARHLNLGNETIEAIKFIIHSATEVKVLPLNKK